MGAGTSPLGQDRLRIPFDSLSDATLQHILRGVAYLEGAANLRRWAPRYCLRRRIALEHRNRTADEYNDLLRELANIHRLPEEEIDDQLAPALALTRIAIAQNHFDRLGVLLRFLQFTTTLFEDETEEASYENLSLIHI